MQGSSRQLRYWQGANAITVDVEDYFHVAALAESIRREDWDQWQSRVVHNTQRLLDVFDEYQVSGTFFMLGWVAERHPELVKEIVARGHELASHGYSHQLIYRQSPQEFRAETRHSKALLEDLAQRPVEGYRAASYSITRDSLWALDVLAEEGFVWDSSIFPVHHDRYGIPGASRWPGVVTGPGGGSLVEFPPSTAHFVGQRLPIAGGGYFRLYPYALTRAGLRQVNRQGRPFIFYLHPWEVDPDQPRVPARWLSRFRHYNNLHRCEPRLRRLLGDFRFGTVREALEGLRLLSSAPVRRAATA